MTEPEQQPPALVENMLLLRKEDFDDLLDRAAERGAERCLAHLGLENGSAAKDIRVRIPRQAGPAFQRKPGHRNADAGPGAGNHGYRRLLWVDPGGARWRSRGYPCAGRRRFFA